MMVIHSSLFVTKVMVKRMALFVPEVVKELLQVVANARKHDVFFDNFFTSLSLLEDLKNMSLVAIGTIRSNKVPGLPNPSNAEMAKKDRGLMSVCNINDVCLVCWVDNNVVRAASYHLTY